MGELTIIGLSEYGFAAAPGILMTYGLGSCIGIALYDPELRMGSLAHTLLPTSHEGTLPPVKSAKFTDLAINYMVEELVKSGCAKERLVAKLAGGASMFDSQYRSFRGDIGQRNVDSAKYTLAGHGIPLLAEDTGGDYGRTVEFHVSSGLMLIKAMQKPSKTI
ncbi:chemotaxis protein CheD [Geomobilimonas luticola]|uniref:Probable chemoreceptor glutamine deamidase CheD n=1 Tax=Geomobilimonas luticola TaxID=1114878 RepID=A0ABS5S808_9BACT|nr:chemotaxis protein CheD [Geomobilimonas luticola]MBT0651506.1 chemotaxis protein CheD [Geomobilimonas luticola]